MPRPSWIGAFSTTTITDGRDDIELVSINPHHNFPRARILLHCDAVQAGQAIFQIKINQIWTSQPGMPPFMAFDHGINGHPQPPVQIGPGVAPAGYSFYTANWTHNMSFLISAQQPHLRFKYQKPSKNGHNFDPIYFRTLRFYQHVQTGVLALDID